MRIYARKCRQDDNCAEFADGIRLLSLPMAAVNRRRSASPPKEAERLNEQLLAGFLFARELSIEQRRRVLAETVVRRVRKSGYVCRKGEPASHWYGVLGGLVKLSSVSPEGKPVSFTGVPAGGWFGEGSLLKDEARRYDAVALRDCVIACMPRNTFHLLLDSNLSFNRFVLTQLNERLGQFIGMVEYDRLLRPEARLAHELAALFNKHLYPWAQTRLQVSQEELAHLVGLSRQRVNRALHRLEQAGLVIAEYGEITVVDLDRLRKFNG